MPGGLGIEPGIKDMACKKNICYSYKRFSFSEKNHAFLKFCQILYVFLSKFTFCVEATLSMYVFYGLSYCSVLDFVLYEYTVLSWTFKSF